MAQTPQSIIWAAYSDSARAFSARAPSFGGGEGQGQKLVVPGGGGGAAAKQPDISSNRQTVVGVQPTAIAEVCVKTPQRSGY
jgi:hypothetical protein